ncbi:Hypothetical protein R9X50_00317300 [Acrodontium crateriforme]|uniref:Alpha/beta hydrolase fold-3 domain-containing protein n=1 Tax=Acrodontium crateriforme TaxID=150365 RepID=A0AAQ3M8J7_9PEZI|nr:Hypothetical protein R9X50_00317300 [Acrodontium crateriforme]
MPYAQSWLDMEAASGGRVVLQGSPDEIKGMYDGLVQALLPLLPPPSGNVDVKEGEVDGIKYRTYYPKGATGPLPTAIWTHGGGWMTGDLNADELLCQIVSEHTQSAVVNIDYRLTPDAVWPAQLDDCMKLYRWAFKNADSIGADPKKFYTIGGSAGGGLALAIANQVVNDPVLKDTLKGIVAMVPCTTHFDNVPAKYQSMYKSYTENAKDVPIIDKGSMETFYKYAEAKPDDASCFTILATDNHKKFPPTYFTSCEFDPLRDDAYVMEAALKEAGVATQHKHYPGLPHYFWIFPQVPEGQQYVADLIGGITWLKSQM